jgi:peptide deformylase
LKSSLIYSKDKILDINGEEQIDYVFYCFHVKIVLHENNHLSGKMFLQRIKTEDFAELHWEENLDIRKN